MSHVNWKEAIVRASIVGGIASLGVFSALPDAPITTLIRPALVGFGIAFLAVLRSIDDKEVIIAPTPVVPA